MVLPRLLRRNLANALSVAGYRAARLGSDLAPLLKTKVCLAAQNVRFPPIADVCVSADDGGPLNWGKRVEVNARNVGRMAERIAMNELEARGFHIIDLAYMSKTSANVDFIASKDGKSYNVQVKGTSNPLNSPSSRWAVQYGYCDEEVVENRRPFFNSKTDFALLADVIVLVAVNSPSRYRAIVLPVARAEEAAQVNISGYYRQRKASGEKRTPNKVWTDLEAAAKPRKLNASKDAERELLKAFEGQWDTLGGLVQ